MPRSPYWPAWLIAAAAAAASGRLPRGAAGYFLPVPVDGLAFWERASSSAECAADGFALCTTVPNLPSNFCCPSDAVCNVLAGNTTILCCPDGVDCSSINPITCDVSQQNADLFPSAPIKTTALNGALAKCGSKCCPFGYSCDSEKLQCSRNSNQLPVPLQSPTTSATTTTKTTTTTAAASSSISTTTSRNNAGTNAATTTHATATQAHTSSTADVLTVQATTRTAAPSPSSSTDAAGSTSADASGSDSASSSGGGSNSSTASIVGGVIGGLAGLLLIGAAVWFLCGRRLRKQGRPIRGGNAALLPENKKLSRSTSSFGNIINNPLSISSPKPQSDGMAFRTDFLRKIPSSSGGASGGYDVSRPVTPANSGGALLDDDTAGGAGSTVGTVGISPSLAYGGNSKGKGRAKLPSSSPLSASMARDLPPAPDSPSPPPLALRQAARRPISVAPIRGMYAAPPATRQQQQQQQRPKQQREPSMEEINIGADPSIIDLGRDLTTPPPLLLHQPSTRDRSTDRMTTFSGLMKAANLDPERPFVPGSTQSSPASRRR